MLCDTFVGARARYQCCRRVLSHRTVSPWSGDQHRRSLCASRALRLPSLLQLLGCEARLGKQVCRIFFSRDLPEAALAIPLVAALLPRLKEVLDGEEKAADLLHLTRTTSPLMVLAWLGRVCLNKDEGGVAFPGVSSGSRNMKDLIVLIATALAMLLACCQVAVNGEGACQQAEADQCQNDGETFSVKPVTDVLDSSTEFSWTS